MPTQEELNNKYKNNLSTGSVSLTKRDPDNNIILNNDNLITKLEIEPVNWDYTNESINDVIETRFSYYTFPPRVTIVNKVNDDISTVELPDVVLEDQTQIKTFYVKYQPASQDISSIDIRYANGEGKALQSSKTFFYPGEDYHYLTIDFTKVANTIVNNATTNQNQIKGRIRANSINNKTVTSMPSRPTDFFDVNRDINYDPYAFSYDSELIGKRVVLPYNINSMLEERISALTWGNLVDGQYVFDRDQSFVITKEILNLEKDLQFTIRLQLNHYETAVDRNISYYNVFAFRLVKYDDNVTDKRLYTVLETVSTLTQGNIADTTAKRISEQITAEKQKKTQLETSISLKQTEITTAESKLTKLTADAKIAETAYKTSLEIYNSISSFFFIRKSNAKQDLDFKLKQYETLTQLVRNSSIDITNLKSQLTTLQNQLAVVNNIIASLLKFDPSNLKYIFVSDQSTGAFPDMSIFHIEYTLKREDMKLGDRYDIEGLINYRDVSTDKYNYEPLTPYPKPGLDIRQSYWEVKSIDK